MKSNLPLILYADDDDAFLRLFQMGVGENKPDFQMKYYSHGKDLLASLSHLYEKASLLPRLIILDLNMPVMDGMTTLKYLKSSPVFRTIPVLIISDSEEEKLQEKVCHLGAEAFVVKPMNFDDIQKVIVQINTYLKSDD